MFSIFTYHVTFPAHHFCFSFSSAIPEPAPSVGGALYFSCWTASLAKSCCFLYSTLDTLPHFYLQCHSHHHIHSPTISRSRFSICPGTLREKHGHMGCTYLCIHPHSLVD